jgi:hypothetical protein
LVDFVVHTIRYSGCHNREEVEKKDHLSYYKVAGILVGSAHNTFDLPYYNFADHTLRGLDSGLLLSDHFIHYLCFEHLFMLDFEQPVFFYRSTQPKL